MRNRNSGKVLTRISCLLLDQIGNRFSPLQPVLTNLAECRQMFTFTDRTPFSNDPPLQHHAEWLPGEDSPITNLSSEAPDPLLFSGHGWDPYNPYLPPPLGDGPVVPTDCSNITWSDISQLNADLMAQLAAAGCQPPPPGPPGPWPDPPIWIPPPFPDFTFTPPVGDPQSPWGPPSQTISSSSMKRRQPRLHAPTVRCSPTRSKREPS